MKPIIFINTHDTRLIGHNKMTEKLQESAQTLRCLNKIEIEAFRLYETLSKKINPPESSFILGLAYDSLKCAKTIQGILDYIDPTETENMNCKKNLSELANNISKFTKKISKTNNLNYEISCETLKELTNMEEQLSEVYVNYLQSPSIKIIADEFSKLALNLSNFKKIFETFAEQKQKHRETLIEIIYCFEAKESERLTTMAPTFKYKNPDQWIRESTLHSFTDPQTKENI
jgi:rubrerythrin